MAVRWATPGVDWRNGGITLGRCAVGRVAATAGGRSFWFGSVVEGGGVGIGRSGAALARGEDEFCGCGAVAMHEDHVAAGAVEQFGENLSGDRRVRIGRRRAHR